jgi:hypothetical protein
VFGHEAAWFSVCHAPFLSATHRSFNPPLCTGKANGTESQALSFCRPAVPPARRDPLGVPARLPQYDQMVRYATAVRLGTAETEAILRRFTCNNVQYPTCKALAELGKAVKTVFLCRYFHSE